METRVLIAPRAPTPRNPHNAALRIDIDGHISEADAVSRVLKQASRRGDTDSAFIRLHMAAGDYRVVHV